MNKEKFAQLIFLLIATLVILANPVYAANNAGKNSIIGTWLLTVDTGFPGAPPITALQTFERGGTLVASQNGLHANSENFDPVCGCNGGNGHGIWKRIGPKKYEFKFTFLVFAGPLKASFPINVSEPVIGAGQHIGYGLVKEAVIVVDGDEFTGTNVGAGLNLEGEILNPAFGPLTQSIVGKRLKLKGEDLPL